MENEAAVKAQQSTKWQRIKVPKFDETNAVHVQKAIEYATTQTGIDGWEFKTFDQASQEVVLIRRALMHTVVADDDGEVAAGSARRATRKIELKSGTKPSEAEKIAAEFESDPANNGYYMTEFQPFLIPAWARLMKLTDKELVCRGAIATALTVKPWDVQVEATRGGGFRVTLPTKYVPSRHDEKLQEVAESLVGSPGWYWDPQPSTRTGRIVPSSLPTFAKVIPYPEALLPQPTLGRIPPLPMGEALAERGDKPNETVFLKYTDGPHVQLGGTTGSGKSVTLNGLLASAIAGGAELAIIDVPAKAVDFENWRPFVRPGGWGCQSFEEAAVVLEGLYKEGTNRAKTLSRYGAKNLSQLPADVQRNMRPILIAADELTGMFAMATVPSGLSNKHPLVVEAKMGNLARELIIQYLEKIAAEMRFVGLHLLTATQVASTSTGISTAFRTNLPHKVILGSRATPVNRKLILRDPQGSPEVPSHVAEDSEVAIGVGVAELEGREPVVFKSFYASDESLIKLLHKRGITGHPAGQLDTITRPDAKAVMELFPALAELKQAEAEKSQQSFDDSNRTHEDWEIDPETGKPLTGFARANAARHAVTEAAGRA